MENPILVGLWGNFEIHVINLVWIEDIEYQTGFPSNFGEVNCNPEGLDHEDTSESNFCVVGLSNRVIHIQNDERWPFHYSL